MLLSQCREFGFCGLLLNTSEILADFPPPQLSCPGLTVIHTTPQTITRIVAKMEEEIKVAPAVAAMQHRSLEPEIPSSKRGVQRSSESSLNTARHCEKAIHARLYLSKVRQQASVSGQGKLLELMAQGYNGIEIGERLGVPAWEARREVRTLREGLKKRT